MRTYLLTVHRSGGSATSRVGAYLVGLRPLPGAAVNAGFWHASDLEIIVAEAGTAIGVVCTTTSPREGGPNARLSDNLPGWVLSIL